MGPLHKTTVYTYMHAVPWISPFYLYFTLQAGYLDEQLSKTNSNYPYIALVQMDHSINMFLVIEREIVCETKSVFNSLQVFLASYFALLFIQNSSEDSFYFLNVTFFFAQEVVWRRIQGQYRRSNLWNSQLSKEQSSLLFELQGIIAHSTILLSIMLWVPRLLTHTYVPLPHLQYEKVLKPGNENEAVKVGMHWSKVALHTPCICNFSFFLLACR